MNKQTDEIIENIKNIFSNNISQKMKNYCDYYKNYKKYSLKMLQIIKKYSQNGSNKIFDTNFYNDCKYIREKNMEIYREFVKGNLQSSSTKMSNLLFRKKFNNKPYIEYFKSDKDSINIFYRNRSYKKDLKSQILSNIKNELFHVPFNQREKIGNARFSISGFPCLYLASSKECCIKEANINDKKDNFIVARFHLINNNVTYYDFTNSWDNIKDINHLKKEILKSFEICAISFKKSIINGSDGITFIPCYVIPQLISSAISSNSLQINDINKRICIKYLSTHFNSSKQYNYVFIPKRGNLKRDLKYDTVLQNMFTIVQHEHVINNQGKILVKNSQ